MLLKLSLLGPHCRYSGLSSTLSNSPHSSLQLSRLSLTIYTAHLSTVHLDDSELGLSLTHSIQVSRAQLVEESLSLTLSHSKETQLEDSS